MKRQPSEWLTLFHNRSVQDVAKAFFDELDTLSSFMLDEVEALPAILSFLEGAMIATTEDVLTQEKF